MKSILEDIRAVVGVTGCFVCNSEGQLLASAMPDLFDENILSTVGRTMAQTVAGLATTRRRKVGDIDLVYEQGRLIAKNLGESCLCILCVRNINVPLLNLTANLAARKLTERLKALSPTEMKVKAPDRPKVAPELTVDGTFFTQMEHELTRVMGPVAPLIINDEVAALGADKGAFPRDRMAELVEKVSSEIADEGKRAKFQRAMLEAIETLR
jgi:predicted regulator of Ras-like GTPase activity (Roadblock/LC7/MglB family)